MSKINELKLCEADALGKFSDDLEIIISEMDELYFYIDKKEKKKYEQTYRYLVYLWEQIQNILIELIDADRRIIG